MEMIKVGDLVETICDISAGKYHNGYTKFPKGSVMQVKGVTDVSIIAKPIDIVDIDQPSLVVLMTSAVRKLPVWENGKFSL